MSISAVFSTVGWPPTAVTAPPLIRICPAALRLAVMVFLAVSPSTVSRPAPGMKVALIAIVVGPRSLAVRGPRWVSPVAGGYTLPDATDLRTVFRTACFFLETPGNGESEVLRGNHDCVVANIIRKSDRVSFANPPFAGRAGSVSGPTHAQTRCCMPRGRSRNPAEARAYWREIPWPRRCGQAIPATRSSAAVRRHGSGDGLTPTGIL